MTSEPIKPAAAAPVLDRRGALARLLQLAAGLLGLSAAAGCPGGGRASQVGGQWPATKATYERYELSMRDVPLNVGYDLLLNGREAYLIHSRSAGEDIWTAVDRRCTHAGCRLSWDANGEQLVCPCHGSKFDAQGLPISGPAKRPLRTWPVSLANGRVIIETGKPPQAP
jgi:Rieske Fe-S protein